MLPFNPGATVEKKCSGDTNTAEDLDELGTGVGGMMQEKRKRRVLAGARMEGGRNTREIQEEWRKYTTLPRKCDSCSKIEFQCSQ